MYWIVNLFLYYFKMYYRWQCLKCGCTSTTDSIEWRYRLSLMVSDGPVLANICIFGSVLDPYVGMSSNQFVRYICKYIRSGTIKGRPDLIMELCPLITNGKFVSSILWLQFSFAKCFEILHTISILAINMLFMTWPSMSHSYVLILIYIKLKIDSRIHV